LAKSFPAFIASGAPDDDYPFSWSVCSWIDGDLVSQTSLLDLEGIAIDTAKFLRALHQIPANEGPQAGPHSFFRGASLHVYDTETRCCIEKLKGEIDSSSATSVWEAALIPPFDARNLWVHGDFAPSNLLVANGRLTGVIDFGCCAVGDPACDLVLAWTLLDRQSRKTFRSAINADERTWARARGWALEGASASLHAYRFRQQG
jgi:aminoglycoside phosphotransferase (APT) family kinase protein